jgi:hypothetical protein
MVEEKIVPTNNPAGRLYEILTRAIEIGQKKKKKLEHLQASLVLAEALEIAHTDSSREVFDGIYNLFRLVNDTELSINKLQDVNRELYLSPIIEIKDAFGSLYLNLSEDWALIAMGIDRGTLEKLKFCADALSRQQGEIPLNVEEMNELHKEVRVLLERVIDAELNEDIRSFIFDKLQDIEQAIINYKFKGSEGLQRVIEATLGATLMNEDIRKEGENPIVASFFTTITRVASMLSIYSNTKQLGADVGRVLQKLLPGAKDM